MVAAPRRGQASQALTFQVRRWPGRLLLLGVLIVSIGIVPLAAASPPDPLWVPGWYDAADFDDVVVTVVSATGAFEHAPPVLAKPDDVITPAICRADARAIQAVAFSTTRPRAPPA